MYVSLHGIIFIQLHVQQGFQAVFNYKQKTENTIPTVSERGCKSYEKYSFKLHPISYPDQIFNRKSAFNNENHFLEVHFHNLYFLPPFLHSIICKMHL
jgi:hypothetical protein